MKRTISQRQAASLIEFLVAVAIIGVLIGLLLPAVSKVRRQALDTVCKNNLKQINLAVAQFHETQKKLPPPGNPGVIGGWTIEALPYLEQKILWQRVTPGTPVSSASGLLLRQPRIMTCPARAATDPPVDSVMDHAHYLLLPVANGRTFDVIDAPLEVNMPWATGPQMVVADVVRRVGPHNRGYFSARGYHEGVEFVPGPAMNP